MMYCVNCEYPVTRAEVDNRKCNNCGNDPAHPKNTEQSRHRDPWLMFGIAFSVAYFSACFWVIWNSSLR